MVDNRIYGARVTTDGAVLDPDGVVLSLAPNAQTDPIVASNGREHLVAWLDAREHTSIYLARVSAAGEVVEAGARISSPTGPPIGARVASNGSDFLVVWQTSSGTNRHAVHGARVSATGEVLDPEGFLVSVGTTLARDPDVASAGGDYLAVWTDGGHIHGARVSPSGDLLGSEAVRITTTSGSGRKARVGSNGSGYLVVWADYGALTGSLGAARLSGEAVVLGRVVLPSGMGYRPAIASNGDGYLVVAQDRSLSGDSLSAVRVSASGEAQDPSRVLVAQAARALRSPSVASDGTDYFVAWQNRTWDGT